ncbi:hypothetical protein [Streptomyces sp. NPDC003077]|uniref:hypothetical protein n=1 Tax=Streptomyces sp. NPDC003077 TaxID=3154443 RepID=UPI0033A7C229
MRITDCEMAHLVVNEARAEDALRGVAAGQLVEQARRLAEKAEELLEQAVIAERQRDTPWEQIGQALGGLSKSAAHKRYGAIVNEWAAHYDGTSTEDEDTGEEVLGPATPFVVAYRLVERTWKEAEEIIGDQDLLAALRNATVAASGTSSPRTGDQRAMTAEGEDSGLPFLTGNSGMGRSAALAALVARRQEAGQSARSAAAHLFEAFTTSSERRYPFEPSSLEARLTIVEHQVAALLAHRATYDKA